MAKTKETKEVVITPETPLEPAPAEVDGVEINEDIVEKLGTVAGTLPQPKITLEGDNQGQKTDVLVVQNPKKKPIIIKDLLTHTLSVTDYIQVYDQHSIVDRFGKAIITGGSGGSDDYFKKGEDGSLDLEGANINNIRNITASGDAINVKSTDASQDFTIDLYNSGSGNYADIKVSKKKGNTLKQLNVSFLNDLIDIDVQTTDADKHTLYSDIVDIADDGSVDFINGAKSSVVPQDNNDLVNKEYVDSNVSKSGIELIELTGSSGTLTQEQYDNLAKGNVVVKITVDNTDYYFNDLVKDSNGKYTSTIMSTTTSTGITTPKIVIASTLTWNFYMGGQSFVSRIGGIVGEISLDSTLTLDKNTKTLSVANNTYLPLSGGTITGSLSLSNNKITNLLSPSNANDAANKSYVDTQIAKIDQFKYIVSTNAATTPSGVIWYNGSTKITGTLTATASTEYTIYLVPCKHSATETQKGYDEYLTVKNGTAYSWEILGNTADIDLSPYMKKDADSDLDMNNLEITNLAAPTNATSATNKSYVDNAIATATPNLNIQNGSGSTAIQMKQDGTSGTFDFTNKNPNATAIDSSLTGNITYGATGAFATTLGGKGAAIGKRSVSQGTTTIAKGAYSHAEGDNTVALGNDSHAEGYATTASGTQAHSEGFNTIAKGTASHSEGKNSIATGEFSHAEGVDTSATGNYSHAEGTGTQAIKVGSHAEGTATIASGEFSHAEGTTTIASGSYSFAAGLHNTAQGEGSFAIGKENTAIGSLSVVEGKGGTANGHYSHVEGVYGQSLTAIPSSGDGSSSDNPGGGSGGSGTATDTEPHYGETTHVEGESCIAIGYGSHVGGYSSQTNGQYSFAHGDRNYISGYCSVGFGKGNTEVISGNVNYNFLLGNSNKITGTYTALNNVLTGNGNTIINTTGATSNNIISGSGNKLCNISNSLILGSENGKYNSQYLTGTTNSIIAGNLNTTGGNGTLTIGQTNTNLANYSVVLGNINYLGENATNSALLGQGLITNTANQIVVGKYNAVKTDKVFIVGNGTKSDTALSNAFEVGFDGTAKVGAMGTEKLSVATKGYVDTKSTEYEHNIFISGYKNSKAFNCAISLVSKTNTSLTTINLIGMQIYPLVGKVVSGYHEDLGVIFKCKVNMTSLTVVKNLEFIGSNTSATNILSTELTNLSIVDYIRTIG